MANANIRLVVSVDDYPLRLAHVATAHLLVKFETRRLLQSPPADLDARIRDFASASDYYFETIEAVLR